MAQHPVGPPFLGQLHGRPGQVAPKFLQLGLETGKQGEGVGRGSGESGQNLPIVEAAELPGALLDHRLSQGDLAIGGQSGTPASSYANDGGAFDRCCSHKCPLYFRGDENRVSDRSALICAEESCVSMALYPLEFKTTVNGILTPSISW